ncbi:hypothetical protein [Methylobacterium oxalidis]|uniref:Flagellar FliJ protein n=1 Tax=Methylobacterium oxalidis TaxID=944322 RepID=A0ABQ6DTF7_9HYPH|nr:hypothetical protein [Methylobacterium oxalidis]GJE30866.1 hypothetical protein LDDCCGHA_1036 [Methylobacterium oxalidis]GLS67453.1 hypothetical protein GCM10007888_58370 [Methylobacterium oxalidis]
MLTGDRLRRAERLMAVQGEMRRLAERDLAEARARAAALESDRAALLAALAGPAQATLPLEAAARRLRGLAAEAAEAGRLVAAREDALRESGLAERRAGAQVGRLALEHRREAERREILDRLDALATRGDASLP